MGCSSLSESQAMGRGFNERRPRRIWGRNRRNASDLVLVGLLCCVVLGVWCSAAAHSEPHRQSIASPSHSNGTTLLRTRHSAVMPLEARVKHTVSGVSLEIADVTSVKRTGDGADTISERSSDISDADEENLSLPNWNTSGSLSLSNDSAKGTVSITEVSETIEIECSMAVSKATCEQLVVAHESCFWYHSGCMRCGEVNLSVCPRTYCRVDPDDEMSCTSYATVCHRASDESSCQGREACYFSGSCRWCGETKTQSACELISQCMWLSSGCTLQNTSYRTTLPPSSVHLSTSELIIVVVCAIVGVAIGICAVGVCCVVYKAVQKRNTRKRYAANTSNQFDSFNDLDVDAEEMNASETPNAAGWPASSPPFYPRDGDAFHERCVNVIRATDGAFQKTRLIGRGASGSVYAGMLQDGTIIAVKEVLVKSAASCVDLLAEVKLTVELRHPNIVRVYGFKFDQEEMRLLIFMELVSNGSIGSLVRNMDTPLAESIARVYARQLTSALAYTHSRGVVHRDLKCDNLLLTQDGILKLADFGASKQIGQGATGTLNGAQTMIGTPFFMAPEILLAAVEGDASLDTGYGKRADVWSLGITILEMLNHGIPPWPVQNTGGVILLIASPEGKPTIPEHLSPSCIDFIQRCAVRDPRARSTSAELLSHPWLAEGPDSKTEQVNPV